MGNFEWATYPSPIRSLRRSVGRGPDGQRHRTGSTGQNDDDDGRRGGAEETEKGWETVVSETVLLFWGFPPNGYPWNTSASESTTLDLQERYPCASKTLIRTTRGNWVMLCCTTADTLTAGPLCIYPLLYSTVPAFRSCSDFFFLLLCFPHVITRSS
ncbi:hypothetical protein K440DRAFT_85771 [Wilcoxina mikolae CBS 423.85]|nr:hypothetical protein K440DRAFT_85771 [Wilcoxina mikolae CBS 423.85]